MKQFEIEMALEALAEARATWAKAITKFNADVEQVMGRLLREAAANRMSVEHVARAGGFTPKRVRVLMRNHGLDPKNGRTLLAQQAAEALAENAALMGVEPHEVDLMSPLAYLPMGEQMRRALNPRGVTDLPEDLLERAAAIIEDEIGSGDFDCVGLAQRILNVVQGARA